MPADPNLTAWNADEELVARRYVEEVGPMRDGGLLARALATLDRDRTEAANRARAEVLAEVEGLRALSEAATPGPWEYVTMKRGMADARFVIAAVNLVRALLAVAPTAGDET